MLEVNVANKHDVGMTKNLLTGEEQVIYSDIGYLEVEKCPEAVTKTNPASEFITNSTVIRPRPSKIPTALRHSSSVEKMKSRPSDPRSSTCLLS